MIMRRTYGLIPDSEDVCDFSFAAAQSVTNLPASVDLRPCCPSVLEQLSIGSCTAIAIANCYKFLLMKTDSTVFLPSRLFIYYNERMIQGTTERDSGALIRNGFKSISRYGVCDERLWRYDLSKFKQKPPAICYTEALKNRSMSYQRVSQELNQMKACLAEEFPIVAGFKTYESFEGAEVARTGVLNLPVAGERKLGGHAVLLVGYDSVPRDLS